VLPNKTLVEILPDLQLKCTRRQRWPD